MKLVAIALVFLTASISIAATGPSPYAGQERRELKALSESEITDLLAGKGMGYAKTAELNGYPGPLHVLKMADKLELDADQRRQTQAIFDAMQAKAKRFGAKLVEEERALERLFAARQATAGLTAALTRISKVQAELRAAHLEAHIKQTKILTAGQAMTYQKLRGYGSTQQKHSGHPH